MANINVKKQVESIDKQMERVSKHVQMYSGVSKASAAIIGNTTADIAQHAAFISGVASATMMGATPDEAEMHGNRAVRKVRAALSLGNR